MNPIDPGLNLPPPVARKLRAIRRRARVLQVFRGLALALAVGIAALLLAMVVDAAVGWFAPAGRWGATLIALAVAIGALIAGCLVPLARRRSLVTTARDVDDSVPQLEERWSTVTELAQSADAPAVRGSAAMIERVAVEAESAGVAIVPSQVVSGRPLRLALGWLGGALAAVALLAAFDFPRAQVLWLRFWHPGTSYSLTRIAATPADGWVPKGESVSLSAQVTGRIPRGAALLQVRSAGQPIREFVMVAKLGDDRARTNATPVVPAVPAPIRQFVHALDSVNDAFEYRVRCGDAQTDWHRIATMDRPRISEVRLRVMPPAYTGLTNESRNSLPPDLRVLRGSEVEFGFRSDQSLDRMLLDLGEAGTVQLRAGTERWYEYRALPTNSFTLVASAVNTQQLENRTKPACRVTLYEDQAPTVKLVDPLDDVAVVPDGKVQVTLEAKDDFGIAKAEVVVTTTKPDGQTNMVTLPVELGADRGKPNVSRSLQLDLKALGAKHGDEVSYVVQVTDTKQTPAQVGGEPNPAANQAQTASAKGSAEGHTAAASPPVDAQAQRPDDPDAANASSPRDPAAQASAPPPEAKATADSQTASKAGAKSQGQAAANASRSGKPKDQPGEADDQEHLAAAAKSQAPKPGEPQANQGSSPPSNPMNRRMLDAGQCSACQARNLKVDEWAGTYDGEKRKKLEIAIEPILQRLDGLLKDAGEINAGLRKSAAGSGLTSGDQARVKAAVAPLVEATSTITNLQARTAKTPYAFIGLQLVNIDESQIRPAQGQLGRVDASRPQIPENVAALDQAEFHIQRAREMLADLVRNYETVKRDQKLADGMQELKKMYQIFLEDTQAMLGGGPGPINKYDRKVAEVDEAYVEKLKALLEQKKKIMAELAELLAQDPRLLRRYLAMQQLSATSLRDQLTLLAEAQKVTEAQVRRWIATPESGRAELLAEYRPVLLADGRRLIEDATRLRDNLETWLPLDVKRENGLVLETQAQAERILERLRASLGPGGTNAAAQALAELHALHDALPQFRQVATMEPDRWVTYLANRLPEVEALITAHSGQMKILESLERGDFPKAAEVIQHRTTVATVTLGEKLGLVEQEVASLSPEIAEKAASLNRVLQDEVVVPQEKAVAQLGSRDVGPAAETLRPVGPGFAKAEETFDELLRLMIAKLDQAPPPTDPGSSPPTAEALLAMLEEERKAAESLGLPNRPLNVAVLKDWMKPGQGQGQGAGQGSAQAKGPGQRPGKRQGQPQAEAARAQTEAAQAEAERMEKEARASAKRALAQAQAEDSEGANSGGPAKPSSEAWNKLASKLKKDLLQGRDNTPPEQYRDAIANYFRVIAENPAGKSGTKP